MHGGRWRMSYSTLPRPRNSFHLFASVTNTPDSLSLVSSLHLSLTPPSPFITSSLHFPPSLLLSSRLHTPSYHLPFLVRFIPFPSPFASPSTTSPLSISLHPFSSPLHFLPPSHLHFPPTIPPSFHLRFSPHPPSSRPSLPPLSSPLSLPCLPRGTWTRRSWSRGWRARPGAGWSRGQCRWFRCPGGLVGQGSASPGRSARKSREKGLLGRGLVK